MQVAVRGNGEYLLRIGQNRTGASEPVSFRMAKPTDRTPPGMIVRIGPGIVVTPALHTRGNRLPGHNRTAHNSGHNQVRRPERRPDRLALVAADTNTTRSRSPAPTEPRLPSQ